MAEELSHLDTYSRLVMQRLEKIHKRELPSEIRANFEEALLACQPKRHGVDIRGVLPFHFARLYFVFLLGHDKRSDSLDTGIDCRQKTKPIAHVIYWLVALWPLYLILFFVIFILSNLPPLFTG